MWLTYSKPHRRGASDVFLYSLGTKKITEVSGGFYNDNNPVFDPGGKYLFFISTRYFYPSAGQLDQRYNYYTTDGIFAVTLKAEEASPFKPESDEEKAADEKKDEEKDEKKSAAQGEGRHDLSRGQGCVRRFQGRHTGAGVTRGTPPPL